MVEEEGPVHTTAVHRCGSFAPFLLLIRLVTSSSSHEIACPKPLSDPSRAASKWLSLQYGDHPYSLTRLRPWEKTLPGGLGYSGQWLPVVPACPPVEVLLASGSYTCPSTCRQLHGRRMQLPMMGCCRQANRSSSNAYSRGCHPARQSTFPDLSDIARW